MKMRLFLAASLAVCTLSASAKDDNRDTIYVTTNPVMHCEGCENKIKSNIRFVGGTKKIMTSVPEQKVTIIFDKRKANYDNYVDAFQKIGFNIEPYNKKEE